MTLLLLLIAAQTMSGPTLAEVEALSPERAGERLLRDRTHQPVVAARRSPRHSIGIPGVTDYDLIEAPRSVPGGCVRRRWTARFVAATGAAGASPVFSEARPTEEIALASQNGCPDSGYTLINGGLDHIEAFALLRRLDQLSTGQVEVNFDCTSEVESDLCASQETIRAGLRSRRAWAVMQSSGSAEFWLGEPGQLVTIVRFALDQPEQVSVARRIPAPF